MNSFAVPITFTLLVMPSFFGCKRVADQSSPQKPKIKSILTFERSSVDSLMVGYRSGCLESSSEYDSGMVVSSAEMILFDLSGDTTVYCSLSNFSGKNSNGTCLSLNKKYYHYDSVGSSTDRKRLLRVEEFTGVAALTDEPAADAFQFACDSDFVSVQRYFYTKQGKLEQIERNDLTTGEGCIENRFFYNDRGLLVSKTVLLPIWFSSSITTPSYDTVKYIYDSEFFPRSILQRVDTLTHSRYYVYDRQDRLLQIVFLDQFNQTYAGRYLFIPGTDQLDVVENKYGEDVRQNRYDEWGYLQETTIRDVTSIPTEYGSLRVAYRRRELFAKDKGKVLMRREYHYEWYES